MDQVNAFPVISGLGERHTPIVFWEMHDRDDDTKNTHLWIVNRALEMLTTLSGPEGAAARWLQFFAGTHARKLHDGLWDADNVAPYNDPVAGVPTYASHFYNPVTGKNWLGGTDPTALTQGRLFFNRAVASFAAKDPDGAAYQLGLALHYLTDAGQPMHASNFTNVTPPLMYHQFFENYAITWTNDNHPPAIPYVQSIRSDDPGAYVIEAAQRSQRRSSAICIEAIGWYNAVQKGNPFAWSQWTGIVDPQIGGALRDIREIAAQFLLLWAIQAESSGSAPSWTASDLTVLANAPVAGNAALTGYRSAGVALLPTKQVAYLDSAGHVHELRARVAGTWNHTDLTAATSAPDATGTALVGYSSAGFDSDQVIYLDGAGHIHELYREVGGNWKHADLSEITDAVPATGSGLAAFALESTSPSYKQVAYLDSAGHVHELSIAHRGAGWRHADITQVTDAPPSAGTALVGYSWENAGTKQLVYLTADGHVHELVFVGQWSHADLTQLASAPPAAVGAGLAGYDWPLGACKQVVYVGADGHVHELVVAFRGRWTHSDLTLASSAPEVQVTALAGMSGGLRPSKHVFYLDRDGHVHELRVGVRGIWTYLDLTQAKEATSAAGTALAGFPWYPSTGGASQTAVYLDANGHIHEFATLATN